MDTGHWFIFIPLSGNALYFVILLLARQFHLSMGELVLASMG
jgi:hypothetical protein